MFLLYWTKLFRRKDIAHRDTATKCLDIVSKLNRPIIIKKVSPTKVTRKFYETSVTILAEMWDLFDISRMEHRNILRMQFVYLNNKFCKLHIIPNKLITWSTFQSYLWPYLYFNVSYFFICIKYVWAYDVRTKRHQKKCKSTD